MSAKARWLNAGLRGCSTGIEQAQARKRKTNRPWFYRAILGTHLFLPFLHFPLSASTCHLLLSTGGSHQSINTEALPLHWLHSELRQNVPLSQANLTHLRTPLPALVGQSGLQLELPSTAEGCQGAKVERVALICSAFMTDTEKMRVLFKVPVEHFIK